MGYQEVNNSYLKNQVMGASPIKLVVMLYEGAIRSMKMAKVAIEKQDVVQAHTQLVKAQNIIAELKSSVNTDVDVTISQNLINLYDFCNEQLLQANLNKDNSLIDNAINTMSELLDSWKQLEQKKE
ncbi:MAG: flagellar export chaperone FliS [Liquorilactobacillus nagelii]|jgi:flagellar protein FliS|uniref:Flagellar export chaperone FliS n=1 Tax=Liquorilactobacillus nagelii TaxID=82688 RepID=A0A3S6QXS2_9LACO|nr:MULTISPECIES: flagellar export chaperone FliS [Lactobacillales]AUJ33016.1 flagellar export chaperone FliS [Liquorilactobacillus nagelii]MCC7616621.1 flagellar export chaperone FliS [Liquorilactobacillus nagelii]MCI1633844.1 flagellar export chaperone FliS [Liquorilactobacillus nagelii]MCI1700049.1 flagellar export chaperone FliS [Liquorilactobacillus nagelii]MCI1820212.1 flagellar export chaperone FliS [Carnobacterium maltaromaticum]